MDDYNRLLKISMQEFKRKIEREVDELFEAARALPDEIYEAPFTGDRYRPRAPAEKLVSLKQRVVRARCAQHWFEWEAPKWAQPLPLRLEDCWALNNQPNRRLRPVSSYAQMLRSMGWHLEHAPRFEVFCSRLRAPPPEGGYP